MRLAKFMKHIMESRIRYSITLFYWSFVSFYIQYALHLLEWCNEYINISTQKYERKSTRYNWNPLGKNYYFIKKITLKYNIFWWFVSFSQLLRDKRESIDPSLPLSLPLTPSYPLSPTLPTAFPLSPIITHSYPFDEMKWKGLVFNSYINHS